MLRFCCSAPAKTTRFRSTLMRKSGKSNMEYTAPVTYVRAAVASFFTKVTWLCAFSFAQAKDGVPAYDECDKTSDRQLCSTQLFSSRSESLKMLGIVPQFAATGSLFSPRCRSRATKKEALYTQESVQLAAPSNYCQEAMHDSRFSRNRLSFQPMLQ